MIQKYQGMKIRLLRATSDPEVLMSVALNTTMNKENPPVFDKELAKFILDAEHTSVLEHVVFTFEVEGISRALMAQLTRHRMSSFTCGSQHYQIYTDYNMSTSEDMPLEGADAVLAAQNAYNKLIADGYPREEARMVLPNASCVNLLWTINARSLSHFLRLRLCHRNVQEMQIFAHKVRFIVFTAFPELFSNVSAPCEMSGTCNQGKMSCGNPTKYLAGL